MIHFLTFLLTSAFAQDPIPFPYQRWEATAASRAGFEADSTLHAFTGETQRVQGLVHADLARLAETAGGSVWFLVKDLSTGKEDRDENMMGDLEAERFPRISFQLDGLTGSLAAAGVSALEASGSFTIHGMTQPRVFPVTLERVAGGGLHVRGELHFLQTDHGIEPHSTFGLVKVHDEVKVWFDLSLEPVAGASRTGSSAALSLSEVVHIPGEAERSSQSQATLWTAGTDALVVSSGGWWLAGKAGTALHLDPRAGRALAAAVPVEAAFAEAQTRLTSLKAKLAALAPEQRAKAGAKLEQTIARLEETLATAPAAGAAEIVRTEERIEIKLGSQTWAVLEGLSGEAQVPAALSAMPDLPASVRTALRSLSGTPNHAWIRVATPSGVRELDIRFAAPAPAAIPDWALDPKAWSPVSA
jgi:polyisoprenoid-binding protein YceI